MTKRVFLFLMVSAFILTGFTLAQGRGQRRGRGQCLRQQNQLNTGSQTGAQVQQRNQLRNGTGPNCPRASAASGTPGVQTQTRTQTLTQTQGGTQNQVRTEQQPQTTSTQ